LVARSYKPSKALLVYRSQAGAQQQQPRAATHQPSHPELRSSSNSIHNVQLSTMSSLLRGSAIYNRLQLSSIKRLQALFLRLLVWVRQALVRMAWVVQRVYLRRVVRAKSSDGLAELGLYNAMSKAG